MLISRSFVKLLYNGNYISSSINMTYTSILVTWSGVRCTGNRIKELITVLSKQQNLMS